MLNTWLTPLVLVCGLSSPVHGEPQGADPPRVFLFEGSRIGQVRQQIERGDGRLAEALRRLRSRADDVMLTPVLTVVEKSQSPPSGDKHDYLSIAPYWWPDPSRPDGKPYIRK